MLVPLTATALALDGRVVREAPLGPVFPALQAWLAGPAGGGLVVLGAFGSGKSTLCASLAAAPAPGAAPCAVVPLRVACRACDVETGLERAIGRARLAAARDGALTLLLDGLDEVPLGACGTASHAELFEALVANVGPRWVLTCRPGWFRTEIVPDADQVDSLGREGTETWVIDPLSPDIVRASLADVPEAAPLVRSVEGMLELATSPVLFQALHAALPYIEPGRPIQPWGVFDAWIRHALSTGPGHPAAVAALEELAWEAFVGADHALEPPLLTPDRVARAGLPEQLRRALFVNELAGGLRFGHRSVYEFLLASRIAPELRANQGQGPDALSGLRITEAMRVFLVGRTGPMGARFPAGARQVWIPRGNFVAGGDHAADERPLRIQHLERPFLLDRHPISNADWAAWLEVAPDDRIDANYLPHWGPDRVCPPSDRHAPVYGIWPEDADAYAAWRGARLPSADEWEKAVRGIDGRNWPWGDRFKPAAVVAELGVSRPLPSRALGASGEASLYGAIGGVFEYTASPWRGRPERGRVVMGGCYTHPAAVSRASLRLSHKLSGHLKAGLRLAWDAEE
jgi:formylglycine-generating enzyme required for sulfatase activity